MPTKSQMYSRKESNSYKKKKINKHSKKPTIRKTMKHAMKHALKHAIITLPIQKIELLLLFSTLINYHILLKSLSKSTSFYKKHTLNLLNNLRQNNKYIPNTTTDSELLAIYKSLTKIFDIILIEIEKNKNIRTTRDISEHYKIDNKQTKKCCKHQGGFYFKSLEDKGNKPITGEDLTKLLDEIQQFFYNAKYTSEGQFLQDTDTVLSMLRGDVGQFKSILQYRIFPKYYTPYPPFLKWEGIKEAIDTKKWEDIPDYLLAYQSYLRSRDEYDVERGLKSPAVLQKDLYTGFYNKMAHSLDTNIQQFQQYRNKFQGRFYPIALPQ